MIQYRVAVVGRRKLRTRISTLTKDLEDAETEISQLEGQISVLNATIESLNNTISTLNNTITELNNTITSLRQVINYKNNYIMTLQQILDNNGIPYPPEPTPPTE